MKIVVFLTTVGLGGTEKAAAFWANALLARGHQVELLAMSGGPGLVRFSPNIPYHEASEADEIAELLRRVRPEVIHTHQFGWPGPGDVLGTVLPTLDFRVPVVQTNVFGQLLNPAEDAWITARAFISWTSCVQAAQRAGKALDERFFRRGTVVSYPLGPQEPVSAEAVAAFRREHGVREHEVLCGKIGRPDMIKWSPLAMDGFAVARRANPDLKFLVREPPPEVCAAHRGWIAQGVLIPLPMTSDEPTLRLTLASLDVLLHTSKIGESFGYGIAEAMVLGKPVITNPTPREDQAQTELIEDGACGILASSPRSVSRAILRLAGDAGLRKRFGTNGARRICQIADPQVSTDRLERLLEAAVAGRENPVWEEDLQTARAAEANLWKNGFGRDWRDAFRLRSTASCFGALRRFRAVLRDAGVWPKS